MIVHISYSVLVLHKKFIGMKTFVLGQIFDTVLFKIPVQNKHLSLFARFPYPQSNANTLACTSLSICTYQAVTVVIIITPAPLILVDFFKVNYFLLYCSESPVF